MSRIITDGSSPIVPDISMYGGGGVGGVVEGTITGKALRNQSGAVYTALAAILSELSVEKNGDLPSNMGGKPYITAVDLNLEVKRKFVSNNLILIPSERVIRHENLVSSRTTVSIVIEGTYTIVSTVDGSSVTGVGVGDGLAIGTAVASNIASTNALKNFLLRLFLVTEQSTEDAAKQQAPEETQKAAAEPKEESVDVVNNAIKAIIEDDSNSFDGQKVNTVGDKLTGSTGPSDRKWTLADRKKILKEVQRLVAEEQKTGEVAEV